MNKKKIKQNLSFGKHKLLGFLLREAVDELIDLCISYPKNKKNKETLENVNKIRDGLDDIVFKNNKSKKFEDLVNCYYGVAGRENVNFYNEKRILEGDYEHKILKIRSSLSAKEQEYFLINQLVDLNPKKYNKTKLLRPKSSDKVYYKIIAHCATKGMVLKTSLANILAYENESTWLPFLDFCEKTFDKRTEIGFSFITNYFKNFPMGTANGMDLLNRLKSKTLFSVIEKASALENISLSSYMKEKISQAIIGIVNDAMRDYKEASREEPLLEHEIINYLKHLTRSREYKRWGERDDKDLLRFWYLDKYKITKTAKLLCRSQASIESRIDFLESVGVDYNNISDHYKEIETGAKK